MSPIKFERYIMKKTYTKIPNGRQIPFLLINL